VTAISLPKRSRMTPLARREARWGLLFLSPWIIGFLLFTVFPVIATFAYTFTNISLLNDVPLQAVGFKNYQALANDSQVWASLGVTIKFAALWLPFTIITPFAVALLLNSPKLRTPGLFRILFFLPYVVPFVAGLVIWQGMLNASSGWVNIFLKTIGIANPPDWLQDPNVIHLGLIFVGIWGIGAGVIVNLAGLKGVPTELYDAAKIDGAGWWGQLRNVTLPMMSPVIFYTLILAVVEVLQYFLPAIVLKNGTGEPGGSTLFYNLYIYKQLFTFHNAAFAATLAWLLFILTLVVTLFLFAGARRWVYYAGER
jgi:ABC-type sugar transport system permease subunit